MPRNPEELYPEDRGFTGFDVAIDPQDLSPDKLLWCENVVCDEVIGELRTRPGWGRVIERPFNRPFRVMGGARGGRIGTGLEMYDIALRNGGWRGYYDKEDYALTVDAFPSKNIEAGTTGTEVLFTAGASMSNLGIAELHWAFDYIEGVQTAASISTFTATTTHYFEYPGIYNVRVWGDGSDGNTYRTSMVLEAQETPGVSLWDFSFDGNYVDVLSLSANPASLTGTGGTVEISWATEGASRVILTNQGETEAEDAYLEVGQTGSKSFDITESTYFTIEAQGALGPILREILVPVTGTELPSVVWAHPPWGMGDGGRAPGGPPAPPGGPGGGNWPPGGNPPGGGGPGGGGVGPAGEPKVEQRYSTPIWLFAPHYVVDGQTFRVSAGAAEEWFANVDGAGTTGEIGVFIRDTDCSMTLAENPIEVAPVGGRSEGSTTGRAVLAAGKSRGTVILDAQGGGLGEDADGNPFRSVSELIRRDIVVLPADLHLVMEFDY